MARALAIARPNAAAKTSRERRDTWARAPGLGGTPPGYRRATCATEGALLLLLARDGPGQEAGHRRRERVRLVLHDERRALRNAPGRGRVHALETQIVAHGRPRARRGPHTLRGDELERRLHVL